MPSTPPLVSAKRLWSNLRKRFATIDRPPMSGLYVDVEHETLDHDFRNLYHWEGADAISYNYRGEVLNLRQPCGTDDAGDQLANHLRSFDTEDGRIFVACHREKSRYEEWHDHYNEIGFSWETGLSELVLYVESAGYAFDRVHSSDVSFTS